MFKLILSILGLTTIGFTFLILMCCFKISSMISEQERRENNKGR